MSDTLRITSPVDGSTYAQRPLARRTEVLAALARAAAAQRDWQATALERRLALLERAVQVLEGQREVLAQELSWQMGRPLSQGGGEIDRFAERARHMLAIAPQALADIDAGSEPGLRRRICRRPLGVVLLIAPWNYPYLTAVNALWPALAAGNAVLLKPASQTALTGERLAQALTAAGLPEGLCPCLYMDHDSAAALMQQQSVGLVCFTGSVAGGRAVQRALAAGPGFAGANLELGGKDPAYVRGDADIEAAAEGIADGALFNSGQSCCAVERAYVHSDIYHDFVDALRAAMARRRLGHPLHADTTLGPMVSAVAADTVRAQVAAAQAGGARALLDAAGDQPGSPYLAPQLLVEVDHRMALMREESFGPVLGLMRVGGDAEALALMNDSDYGLSASIWTADLDAAERLGGELAVGTVFANRCDYLDPALAWSGLRYSGRGCSLSVLGYGALTRPQSFYLKSAP